MPHDPAPLHLFIREISRTEKGPLLYFGAVEEGRGTRVPAGVRFRVSGGEGWVSRVGTRQLKPEH
jgi:hypothetical protein